MIRLIHHQDSDRKKNYPLFVLTNSNGDVLAHLPVREITEDIQDNSFDLPFLHLVPIALGRAAGQMIDDELARPEKVENVFRCSTSALSRADHVEDVHRGTDRATSQQPHESVRAFLDFADCQTDSVAQFLFDFVHNPDESRAVNSGMVDTMEFAFAVDIDKEEAAGRSSSSLDSALACDSIVFQDKHVRYLPQAQIGQTRNFVLAAVRLISFVCVMMYV